eukprot:9491088-Pyramimonas_sp.AAC.1
MQTRARQTAEEASKEADLLFNEVASLDRDLESLAMYLRETRRLRAKSEEALNWMQENYNARVRIYVYRPGRSGDGVLTCKGLSVVDKRTQPIREQSAVQLRSTPTGTPPAVT